MQLGIRTKLSLAAVGLMGAAGVLGSVLLGSEAAAITERRADTELHGHADLVALHLAAMTTPIVRGPEIDAVADALGAASGNRVTIAELDGTIAGDSAAALDELVAVGGASEARPEIARALDGHRTEALRRSPVTQEEMRYVAVPVRHQGVLRGAVRVGTPASAGLADVTRLNRALWLVGALAFAAALGLAFVASHLVSQGIRQLAVAARRLASGDLEARARPDGEDELAQLGRSIDELAEGLRGTLRELVQERDLFSGLLDNLTEGVLLLDRDGKVALLNPALREMLLLSPDDVGKHPIEVIRHAQLAELLEVARRGAAKAEIEVGGLKPRRLLVRAEALDGDPGGVFVVFYDVTDLRRLETLRRDFVANASHELRTPVTSIRSAAETLQVVGGGEPATFEKFLGIIERNAARLQRLLEDLLDLSRIESRELKPHREPIALRLAADRAASLLADRAARARTTIAVTIEDDVIALADARALEQVLENLLDNAIKYCPGSQVRVSGVERDGAVVLEVADTGPGIEARHLDRLFERFYRVDAGRSRQLGGTGLGLAIVKHLVEAMDGTIEVASVVGRGTSFQVRLPAPGAASEEPSLPPPPSGSPSAPPSGSPSAPPSGPPSVPPRASPSAPPAVEARRP